MPVIKSLQRLQATAAAAAVLLLVLLSAYCLRAPLAPAVYGSAAGRVVPSGGGGGAEAARLRQLYLQAVRDSIVGHHLATPTVVPKRHVNVSELQTEPYDAAKRSRGVDWPLYGLSMAGTLRLDNLRGLLEDVLRRGVPGSFVECGVWRGGASLFAKAVLEAHGERGRAVHLVDSFQGLPPPTSDKDQAWWSELGYLRVPQAEVAAAFERFGLLDDGVHFHKGFFRYSLPAWRARDSGPIAILRMDGDMYESTADQLYNLWGSLSPGGYLIIDDWSIPECQRAVRDFFARHRLPLEVTPIDDFGAYLQKAPAEGSGGGGDAAVDLRWYRAFNASRSAADAAGAAR